MPVRGLLPVPAVESVPATEAVSEVSSCTEYCSIGLLSSPPLASLALNQCMASCIPWCAPTLQA